jgi:hypothetical protein
MRFIPALLCAACLLPPAAGAQPAEDAPASDYPVPLDKPPLVDDWLPQSWWRPIDIVSGPIDGDAFDDMVLVLERPEDAPEDADWPRGSRALFILFRDPDGGWRRGPLVPGLLPCATCMGTLSGITESAIFDLAIPQPGILEIAWVHRRYSTKAVRLRLGWQEQWRHMILLTDDVSVINPFGGRSRVRRDYRRGMMWVDGQPKSMRPEYIRVEQVSADAY